MSNEQNSDTPRTDAEERNFPVVIDRNGVGFWCVRKSFAEKLERELAAAIECYHDRVAEKLVSEDKLKNAQNRIVELEAEVARLSTLNPELTHDREKGTT